VMRQPRGTAGGRDRRIWPGGLGWLVRTGTGYRLVR
jgi:hypothetical protein